MRHTVIYWLSYSNIMLLWSNVTLMSTVCVLQAKRKATPSNIQSPILKSKGEEINTRNFSFWIQIPQIWCAILSPKCNIKSYNFSWLWYWPQQIILNLLYYSCKISSSCSYNHSVSIEFEAFYSQVFLLIPPRDISLSAIGCWR